VYLLVIHIYLFIICLIFLDIFKAANWC